MRIVPSSVAFTVLLGLLAALPALSIDLSAPTLPLLPDVLDTTTTVAGLTLSVFMGGFALGQFAGGRWSDRNGRRPVLLAGLACYAAAGVACALARSGPFLVAARLVQGIGAGSCSVLAFAIVQDLFEGEAARSKRSYVTVVFGVVPMCAPAVGAALSALAGWRSVHWVLALAGTALLSVAWSGISESRRIDPACFAGAEASAKLGDARLRDDWPFLGVALANALSYGCIFGYIAGSPVIVIGQMALSPGVFAAMFASTAAALTAGAWTSGRLGRRGLRAPALLTPSLCVSMLAALALAGVSAAGVTSVFALLPLLLVVFFARGIIAPNMQHLAIERRGGHAGAASAILGVSQLALGALSSAAVAALLPRFGAVAVSLPMAVCATLAFIAWRGLRWR